MRCPGIALALTVAQLATGLGLTALCVHLMLKLPSLTTRDWPVWAAGPVVSFVLSSLSMVLCMVAAAFLVLHVLLYIDRYSECRYDLRGHQCFCTLPSHSQLYRYSNVTCLQVGGSIKGLFYTTAAVSVVAGISCLWYLAILWSSRYVYFYSGVAQVKSIPQVLEQYSTQQHST
ncbi:sarcospan-like isoform X2 [Ornithodoros turicata]|uniref:sarcospan-like isoform X2 n=1 Tax=Ornithodoros turicata TaxID=34597 RepID=UPI003138DD06